MMKKEDKDALSKVLENTTLPKDIASRVCDLVAGIYRIENTEDMRDVLHQLFLTCYAYKDVVEAAGSRISYGQGDESIYTPEGKKRLWEEEKIVYVGGVHAFKITPRDEYTPLATLYSEDDESLFISSRIKQTFDASWLVELEALCVATREKLREEGHTFREKVRR